MKLLTYSYKYFLSIVLLSCFFILSGCSSPSSDSCPTSKTSLEFYWVCTPSQSGSSNVNHHELTYDGKPVCLVQPPVLTSQSFIAMTDESDDNKLLAVVTLNDEATKAFRKSTSMATGQPLAMILKSPAKSKNSGWLIQTSCINETTILNIVTVQAELGGRLEIVGWQSQQQIQQLIASIKQRQAP